MGTLEEAPVSCLKLKETLRPAPTFIRKHLILSKIREGQACIEFEFHSSLYLLSRRQGVYNVTQVRGIASTCRTMP